MDLFGSGLWQVRKENGFACLTAHHPGQVTAIEGYTPLDIDKDWPRLLSGEHKVNIIRWMTSYVNHACSLFCSIKTDQPMSVTNRHTCI